MMNEFTQKTDRIDNFPVAEVGWCVHVGSRFVVECGEATASAVRCRCRVHCNHRTPPCEGNDSCAVAALRVNTLPGLKTLIERKKTNIIKVP